MVVDQPIREWIDSVCRRSSRITGWPLVFDTVGRQSSAHQVSTSSGDRSQWRSHVSNGTELVGTLRLEPQQGRQRDERYLKACELAELTLQLIERVLTEQASNELLRVSNKPRSARPTGSGVSVTIERPSTERHPLTYVHALLRMAVRLSGLPAAALFIQEPGTDQLRLQAQHGPDWLCIPQPTRKLADSPIDAACLKGEYNVVRRSESSLELESVLPEQAAIGVCQGITAADRPLGTLWLYDRRDRRMTLRERHVFSSVAVRLGELIERTLLLHESERSQQLRVELQVAARSQPSARIQHGGTEEWYELAGHSESSEEVGGDLFEVITLPGDRLFLAIGDAAGHSIPAALVMASVRGAIRALFDPSTIGNDSATSLSPQEVLRRLNTVLHGIVNSHQFMTMLCAIIDGRQMQMEYANAGHPPSLLIRNGETQRLDSHGLVLGVLDDAAYESTVLPIQRGDLLAFYTDGVSEAVDGSQQMFGADGIATISHRHHHECAALVLDEVWRGLQQHLSDRTPPDDRTLALLRINGPAQPQFN